MATPEVSSQDEEIEKLLDVIADLVIDSFLESRKEKSEGGIVKKRNICQKTN